MKRALIALLSVFLCLGYTHAILEAQSYAYYPDDPYLVRIHADSHYRIYGCSDSGDVVQLMDGSMWSVRYEDRLTILRWAQSNDVFIKPQYSWFSSFPYVLHNRSLNQTVEVSFFSPLPWDAQTYRIDYIDPYSRQVILNDNTVWQIDADDRSFAYWKVGQRVVIGVNNNWRHAKFPNIIINLNLHNQPYSQADFFGNRVG